MLVERFRTPLKAWAVLCLLSALAQPMTVQANTLVVEPPQCVEWNEGATEKAQQWVAGFLNGANVLWSESRRNPSDPLSQMENIEQAFEFIDEFCSVYPNSSVAVAAYEFLLQLARSLLPPVTT